uniref:Uncharacterized protein n=1 Tax=Panagrolaimus superbus TaxID=310955 RepID=A0A914YTV7_9BILA
MHIYVKRPTLIFTDLYVSSVCDALSIIETAVIMRNLKIRDFTFEIKKIEVIDGLEVILTDFGDIVIPEDISKETIYAKCYYEQYEVMPKSVFK